MTEDGELEQFTEPDGFCIDNPNNAVINGYMRSDDEQVNGLSDGTKMQVWYSRYDGDNTQSWEPIDWPKEPITGPRHALPTKHHVYHVVLSVIVLVLVAIGLVATLLGDDALSALTWVFH